MPDPVAASLRLAPEALTRPFSAEQFSFSTTNDLEPFRGVLGQERAVEALQFGVAMPRPGYNVFVMGEPGTGRFSFVKRYLKAEGKRLQTPADWVYVNNFDEPREPRALELPAGGAAAFIGDINGLIDNLVATFPAVFEHPTYQQTQKRHRPRVQPALRQGPGRDRTPGPGKGRGAVPRQFQHRVHPDARRQGAGRGRVLAVAGSRSRALPHRYFRAGRAPQRRAGQPAAVEA